MTQYFSKAILKFFLVGVIFFTSHLALAEQQKVVLLTSLDTKATKTLFWKFRFKTYVQKLEEDFRKQFAGTRYIIEIVHDANQFDLWSVLHDPRNVAVFWLSHASFSNSADNSQLMSVHKILDVQGYDVSPVFEKVHPNIRFLSVIACHSKGVLEDLPESPVKNQNPYLRLHLFDDKVEARKGLKKMIQEAKKELNIPEIRLGYESYCPVVEGYKVKVTRSFQSPDLPAGTKVDPHSIRPAARILAGQKVVDAFPPVGPNSDPEVGEQVHEIFVPVDTIHLPSFRVDVGENSKIQLNSELIKKLNIGNLNLVLEESDGQEERPWSIVRALNGNPIGIFTHLYRVQARFVDSLDVSRYWVHGSEFTCPPMPKY